MTTTTMLADDVDLEPGKPWRVRRWLLIALACVVAAAAIVGMSALRSASADDDAVQRDGPIITLEPLTTTLGEATLRHARVTLALVLAEGQDPVTVGQRTPELQDALLREVARMDADHLRSSEGSEQLRQQLTEDARGIWGEEVVQRVLLTELLVQ